MKPTTAVVDLGFRGVDDEVAPVQVIHRGKNKSLTTTQRRWLKRRQTIEPAIGHAKLDHRMDRCWLGGAAGDALHAVLCALRASTFVAVAHHRPSRAEAIFLRLLAWLASRAQLVSPSSTRLRLTLADTAGMSRCATFALV